MLSNNGLLNLACLNSVPSVCDPSKTPIWGGPCYFFCCGIPISQLILTGPQNSHWTVSFTIGGEHRRALRLFGGKEKQGLRETKEEEVSRLFTLRPTMSPFLFSYFYSILQEVDLWSCCLPESQLENESWCLVIYSQCYDLNNYNSPRFICWNPSPQVMVLEGWAFGRWSGHGGRAFMSVNQCPSKGDLREISGDHTAKGTLCEPENRLSPNTKSAGTLALDFPAFRTVVNKIWLFISDLVCSILV